MYKYANMSLHEDINSVLIMVITGLERPVLQTFGNEKRVFLTMVVLKRWLFRAQLHRRIELRPSSPELSLKSIKYRQKLNLTSSPNIFTIITSKQKIYKT